MTHRSVISTLLFAIVLGLGSAGSGCNQQAPKAEGDKEGDKKEGDKEGAKAKSDDECERYSGELCKLSGEQSAACAAAKQTAELMPPAACKAGLANLDFSREKLAGAKKKCDELMTKLCADLGPGTTCEMVKTETPKFPPERCASMLDHYAEVLADLQKMAARDKPLSGEQQQAIAAADAPSFGASDSAVTLVEFSDFQCPYCVNAAKTVGQLKDKYGDRIRFVFRQFPLSFHKDAHRAAQAALAAHAQGKFWEYHDRLFALGGKLERESLEAEAKSLGLDMAQFKKALDDAKYADAVDADLKLGEKVSVDGTPTLFLNGKRIDISSVEAVSKEIDSALAAK